jgi:hypothetical protein
VILYPGGDRGAIVSVNGRRRILDDLPLESLLALAGATPAVSALGDIPDLS